MTTDYKIDISNKFIESKGTKVTQLIYMYGFLFVGCFYIIYTLVKGDTWERYPLGLTALFWSFSLYLRRKGKWIYARYFSVSSGGVKWQKNVFNRASFNWSEIWEINFTFPSIVFLLANNTTKNFSLLNITAAQMEELKELANRQKETE